VYKAYLSFYAKGGNSAEVVNKYNAFKNNAALRNAPHVCDLHAIVVHALYDTGDMDEMLLVASELRKHNRLAMTSAECEFLLVHLARTNLTQCESWWMYLSNTEIKISIKVYNQLVTVFSQAQRSIALHVLGHMQASGAHPNEETYAALLSMATRGR
jgi:Pentatricopeptide repeat domain